MATYDLVCLDCGHVFEVFVQGFLKDADRQCPDCGSFKTRQKFSPFLTNAGSGAAASSHEPPASGGFG